MTISPPAKVKPEQESIEVLASGFDTLHLAINVFWLKSDHFDYLASLKEHSKTTRQDALGQFCLSDGKSEWPFMVKPNGAEGYEWIIYNSEYSLKIGAWVSPQSKPSIIAEIRSEALWLIGPDTAVKNLVEILLTLGGSKISLKPSRVDLCVDFLVPDDIWNRDLIDSITTRSTSLATYFTHKKLSGIAIGKGKISARLYDKPLEIRQKSKKFWMYDVWGIKGIPEDKKLIRVEFQLRRDMLSRLAMNDFDDLLKFAPNVWAYCSQKWLKFQTNPGKHHTQRKTLDWWQTIQNGFKGVQNPTPLIRSKSLKSHIDQNTSQAIGNIRSIIAALIEAHELDEYVPAEIEDGLKIIAKIVKKSPESEAAFSESVRDKKATFHRTSKRHSDAEYERRKLGFPREN